MVTQAFSDPVVERVFTSTMAIDTASRQVLEKVGMVRTSSWTREWPDPIPGSEAGEVGYELTRATWTRAMIRTHEWPFTCSTWRGSFSLGTMQDATRRASAKLGVRKPKSWTRTKCPRPPAIPVLVLRHQGRR